MKRMLLLLVAGVLLAGCATTVYGPDGHKLSKTEVAQLREERVAQRLEKRDYRIVMRTMIPNRGPSRVLHDDWDITVHGDSLVSYLPYFGRAYNVPYGGGRGLNFAAPIGSYAVEQLRADMVRIVMDVVTDEDSFQYVLDVFTNGSASLEVFSRNREPVRFNGEMEVVL
ncbi:MAG: DUF4251 domain-containing protein [Prevotella sp.]|nr:DUF4251 domain-containing protein [Prevotella sp.]